MSRSGRALRAGRTAREVLVGFHHSQGLLLSGAVAYYTLLSLVPLFGLLLIALSHVVSQERLIRTAAANLELLVPAHAAAITDHVRQFLAHRQVIGVFGLGVLLFFSAMAFGVLESVMARIFHHRSAARPRHPLLSAVIPYLFVTLLGAGLLVVTMISGALEVMSRFSVALGGHLLPLAGLSRALLHVLGMAGVALILTALYTVLPRQRISMRTAAAGAVAATLLWELVRRMLVWYFATLSMVDVIYGSLATAVVMLATLEAASLIVLLGAQAVAVLERERRRRPGGGASARA